MFDLQELLPQWRHLFAAADLIAETKKFGK
jgi:hypothetical protein